MVLIYNLVYSHFHVIIISEIEYLLNINIVCNSLGALGSHIPP